MISRVLTVLALSAGLSSCISILPDPKPAPAIYRLESAVTPAVKHAKAEVIRVDRPTANQIFNTTDIVVTDNARKLSVIAGANWSEAAPVIIQSSMIDALSESSSFVGLIPTSGARTKTRLHLTIKSFEAKFDEGPERAPLAIVDYRVTYARADDRNLLGTHFVRKTVRSDSINVSAIVSAIEKANHAAMDDIVTWLESQKKTGAS